MEMVRYIRGEREKEIEGWEGEREGHRKRQRENERERVSERDIYI